MAEPDVSPIAPPKVSGLLGSLSVDDLVARVVDATNGGTDLGALLRASPAAFLVEAPEPPAESLEAALMSMRLALAGSATPEVAAGVLVCLAGLAARGGLNGDVVPGDLEGAFLELSALPAAWGEFFGKAADRVAASVRSRKEPRNEQDARALSLARVGRYEILGSLGRGATGTVYRARQAGTRREVALKLLRSDVLTAEILARFEREAVLLGRLEHPAIARVFESGIADVHGDSVPFIALELVEGRSLLEHASFAALSDAERIELIRQVADAVQHAHERGIVHRDLSPSNVLVTPDGQPKIIDFGIARILDPDLRTTALRTLTGAVIGTPAYMSPEQAGGKSDDVDSRTDVWSMGVLLFELLTGRFPLPVEGGSVTDVLRTLVEQEPARLRTLRPTPSSARRSK